VPNAFANRVSGQSRSHTSSNDAEWQSPRQFNIQKWKQASTQTNRRAGTEGGALRVTEHFVS
jgi:hypothetical protein